MTAIIRHWRDKLYAAQDSSLWTRNTRRLIELAAGKDASALRSDFSDYVHWADQLSSHYGTIDSSLLEAFVECFTRLATNLGQARGITENILTTIDRMVHLQRQLGNDTVRLCLAKASYFRALSTDSADREAAIIQAIESAQPQTLEWGQAVAYHIEYLTDSGHYKEGKIAIARLRRELPTNTLNKFECCALVNMGVATFTQLENLQEADRYLTAACAYEPDAPEDEDTARWIATAHHYRGRIAEIMHDPGRALQHYVDGQRFQKLCPEDVLAEGFIHLRIAELLIASMRFNEANDHLQLSHEKFSLCSNRSSGLLQVDLATASLLTAQSQADEAIAVVSECLKRSRRIEYWRGELVCLGYLLTLQVRNGRAIGSIVAVCRLVIALRHGEALKGGVVAGIRRAQTIAKIASIRTNRSTADRLALVCLCPIHKSGRGFA